MSYVKKPFVAFFFPFAAGIAIAYYSNIQIRHIGTVLLLTVPILFLSEKFLFRKKIYFSGLFFYVFLFFFGIYIMQNRRTKKINYPNYQIIYAGCVISPPKANDKWLKYIINLTEAKDTSIKRINTKIIVFVQRDTNTQKFNYGDKIIFFSRIDEITNNANPNEFDYKTFMLNKGITGLTFLKKGDYKIEEHSKCNILKATALKIRKKAMSIYKRYGITNQEFAVLSALTLGYRDEVNTETRQRFANTGAMHILAVSGLHVGIIYLILLNLLAFLDKKKYGRLIKAVIIIASLWLFALIAGLSPSVTRSALMFSIFVIGALLERSTPIYNIIFTSAFIMLAINPYNLFSVGFQLSYAAVLAIVFFQPHIYTLLSFPNKIIDKIWALVSVSIAAQIGTMPIGLYYFHQFPNYFFLTNIIVIPLASIILYLALSLLAVNFIPLIANFFAFWLKLSLKILLLSVSFIDKLPFATTKHIFITLPQLFLIYLIIISFALIFIYKNKSWIYLFLIGLSLFLVSDIFYNIHTKQEKLIILNNRKSTTLLLLSKSNYIISENNFFIDNKQKNILITPIITANRSANKKTISINLNQDSLITDKIIIKHKLFQIDTLKFIIINSDKLTDYKAKKRLKINFIILAHNAYITIKDLKRLFNFQQIIIDGTNRNYKIEKWQNECKKLKIPCYTIPQQGSLTFDLQ